MRFETKQAAVEFARAMNARRGPGFTPVRARLQRFANGDVFWCVFEYSPYSQGDVVEYAE